MDSEGGQDGQDAGLAIRMLARLGVDEGVPAYIAALAAIFLVLILSALR